MEKNNTLGKIKIVGKIQNNKSEAISQDRADVRRPWRDFLRPNYQRLCQLEKKLFDLYDKKDKAETKADRSNKAMTDKLAIGFTAFGSWGVGTILTSALISNPAWLDISNVLGGCALSVVTLAGYMKYYSRNQKFYKNYSASLQGQIEILQQEREVLRNEDESNFQRICNTR